MFGKLKEKFNNAIEGGLQLQQQYLGRDTTNSSVKRNSEIGKKERNVPIEILTGGFVLFQQYEKCWEEIHNNNEQNAANAAFVAKKIEDIERCIQTQRSVMSNLNSNLLGLSALSKQLQSSFKTLQQVQALTEIVEEKLDRLQILCDECDLQEYVLQKQCEVSQYKQQKLVSLEAHRKKVALEHERNIRIYEMNLRRIQIERQAVFDAAFKDDLEEYRQNGSIKKLENTNSTKNVTLEELSIDDTETKDALEDFLND